MLLLKKNTIPFTHLQRHHENASTLWAQACSTCSLLGAPWAARAASESPARPVSPARLSELEKTTGPHISERRSCSLLTLLSGHAVSVASLGSLPPWEPLERGRALQPPLQADRAADKAPLLCPQLPGGAPGCPGRPSAPPQSTCLCVSSTRWDEGQEPRSGFPLWPMTPEPSA